MAYPIELTIGTGNKVTVNYQSHEVSVSLTYQLERGDSDVLAVAREKAPEVVAVHQAAWESVRGVKQVKLTEKDTGAKPEVRHEPISVPIQSQSAGTEMSNTYTSKEEDKEEARNGAPNLEAGLGETVRVALEVETESAKKPNPNAVARDYEASTAGQRMALRALLVQSGAGEETIQESLITRYGCESLDELSYPQACEWLLELQRAERERVRSVRSKLAAPAVCLNGKGHG